ncbi:MAG: response regulator [Candidatus Hydrogenedentes bacterium]|nr:response regulator [Candidatus Hydrogenedentota bacterium]
MANILCVDTDKRFGKYVCAHLTDAGHRCILDNQGKRTLETIEKHDIELVIAEVMLPDMCGFEICRRVRAHEDWFTLPVVLMSTMDGEDEVHHALSQGADDYLIKPFQSNTLVSCVAKQLQEANRGTKPDPITGLTSGKRIRAIIQRTITQKLSFSTAYIEMDHIAMFGQVAGDAPRDKALRHLSRILERYGEDLDTSDFYAAHLGLGHFACVMPPEYVVPYCKRIILSWEKHLPEFYESVGLKMPKAANAQINMGRSLPLLDLTVCVTENKPAEVSCVQEHIDVLNHLRNKAAGQGASGLYLDNRKTRQQSRAPRNPST